MKVAGSPLGKPAPSWFEWTDHSTARGTDNEERGIGSKYPKVKVPLQKGSETLESDFPPYSSTSNLSHQKK